MGGLVCQLNTDHKKAGLGNVPENGANVDEVTGIAPVIKIIMAH
jgi:hypothetical protein